MMISGSASPKWTDAELIAAMAKHPLLIERPVVRTRKGTRLCRPPDRLDEYSLDRSRRRPRVLATT